MVCRARRWALLSLCAAIAAQLPTVAADLYADLGVSRRATGDEIKSAYYALAKKLHPDKNGAADAEERFTRVAAAYETLSDPDKRRRYDAFGPGYASQTQARARRDPFEEFFASQGRASQPRPSFSSTLELDQENFDWFVGAREGGEVRLWLILFYSDTSELSARFAPQWELLAERLHPMIRLGRVNTDSRTSWALVRRYRTLVTRLPTLLMHGDDGGDSERATVFYGHTLSADAVAEWCRRFYPPAAVTRVTGLGQLNDFVRRHARTPGETGVASTLEPQVPVLVLSTHSSHDTLLLRYASHRFDASGAASGAVSGANGGVRIALAYAHVPHLHGSSGSAQMAQALGVTELPALAIWRDGFDQPPEVFRLGAAHAEAAAGGGVLESALADADARAAGLSDDAAQRVRLLRLLQTRARPRLRRLRASNVHELCLRSATSPAARGEARREPSGCLLLLCADSSARCVAAAAVARQAEAALRTAGGAGAGAGRGRGASKQAAEDLTWALVDGVRQERFARALLAVPTAPPAGLSSSSRSVRAQARAEQARAEAKAEAEAPPLSSLLPAFVLLLPEAYGKGLADARWALYKGPSPVGGGSDGGGRGGGGRPGEPAEAEGLKTWLLHALLASDGQQPDEAVGWRRGQLPPLLADEPPGLGARLWSLAFGGATPLGTKLALLGAVLAVLVLGGAAVFWARSQPPRAQPKPQPQPQPQAGEGHRGPDQRQRHGDGSGGRSAHAEPPKPRAGAAEGAGSSAGAHSSHNGHAHSSQHHRHAGHAGSRPSSSSDSQEPSAGARRPAGDDAPFEPAPSGGGVPQVMPSALAAALATAPFCILLPLGSQSYSASGCTSTARVLRSRYSQEGSFLFATLHVDQDDGGNLLFRHIQRVLRQCGCIALRRTSDVERTRVAVYTGPMSPDMLSPWLDRLIGGEIPLAHLMGS